MNKFQNQESKFLIIREILQFLIFFNFKVIAGLGNGLAKTINIDNGATLTTFSRHASQVTKLLRINSQQVITASQDTQIKLWTLQNGTYACGYFNHTLSVKSVVIDPNGFLVSGGCDGTIKVWDTTSGGALLLSFPAHPGGCVNDLKYHPLIGAGAMVSAGADKYVKVWNSAAYSYVLLSTTPMGPVNQIINCLVILRNGKIVAGSNRIDMWTQTYTNDLTGGLNPISSTSTVAILSMTTLDDGLTVACGLANGQIKFFDSVNKVFLSMTLNGHSNQPVNTLDLLMMSSTRQLYLVSGSDDMYVNIWEYSTGYLAKRISMGAMVKSVYMLYNETETSTAHINYINFFFEI